MYAIAPCRRVRVRTARPRRARATRGGAVGRPDTETACPICRSELRLVGTPEVKELIPTSIYPITKRATTRICASLQARLAGSRRWLCASSMCPDLGGHSRTPLPGWRQSSPRVCATAGHRCSWRTASGHETSRTSPDIVSGILLALHSGATSGNAINLGTVRPTTVAEVAHALSGMELDIEPVRNDQYDAGDIRHCFTDLARARTAGIRGEGRI
jgi:nucleoside-diphosphate-sugar epimerase